MSKEKQTSQPKSEAVLRWIDLQVARSSERKADRNGHGNSSPELQTHDAPSAISRRTPDIDSALILEWLDTDLPDEGTENIGAWLEHRKPQFDY